MIQKMLEDITLRFDDVCTNADMQTLNEMSQFAHSLGAKIIYCISPLVQDMSALGKSKDAQRIYPKIWNALSDYRQFYQADIASVPEIPSYVTTASHGLIHVDHRLLKKSAQEMSILVSCSLAKSEIFVPPFNKWNKDTKKICKKNGITLVKFEEGWKCMEYNKFDPTQKLWYVHHREFTVDAFKKWFETQ